MTLFPCLLIQDGGWILGIHHPIKCVKHPLCVRHGDKTLLGRGSHRETHLPLKQLTG